jgi:5'-phosphate synthase pdxT subunit
VALQGDVSLHAEMLRQLGTEPLLVKTPAQLRGVQGLVIPGGESTALLRLMEPTGLLGAIADFAGQGGHIFGTCAGAILLARQVTNPVQTGLGLIDITVERNAYGRQINSTETTGQMRPPLGKGELPMTFIRAPRIIATSQAVKVLAIHDGEPVMVQQAQVIVSTFHPELTNSLAVYTYWLSQIT